MSTCKHDPQPQASASGILMVCSKCGDSVRVADPFDVSILKDLQKQLDAGEITEDQAKAEAIRCGIGR